MTPEQREEIESAIKDLEDSKDIGVIDSLTWPEISTLIQVARQQLNLRVDWEKFAANNGNLESDWDLTVEDVKRLHSLVLQCLTTTPEEKE